MVKMLRRCLTTTSRIILFVNSWSKQPQLPFFPPAFSVVMMLLLEQWSSTNVYNIPVYSLYVMFKQAIGQYFALFLVSTSFGIKIVLHKGSQSSISISPSNIHFSWLNKGICVLDNFFIQKHLMRSLPGAPLFFVFCSTWSKVLNVISYLFFIAFAQ